MKRELLDPGIAHAANRNRELSVNCGHDVDRTRERLLDAAPAFDQDGDVYLGTIRRQVEKEQHSGLVKKCAKGLLCLFALMMLSTNATSQTTFSFAGLAWGDSIQTVDNKLKAAGFTGCRLNDKLMCLARASCDCGFEGSSISHGNAALTDNKLTKVYVRVDNWRTTFGVLVKKYGQPKIGNDDYVSPFEKGDPLIAWINSSGESLELQKDSDKLIYTSGAENRKSQAQDRSNKSVF